MADRDRDKAIEDSCGGRFPVLLAVHALGSSQQQVGLRKGKFKPLVI